MSTGCMLAFERVSGALPKNALRRLDCMQYGQPVTPRTAACCGLSSTSAWMPATTIVGISTSASQRCLTATPPAPILKSSPSTASSYAASQFARSVTLSCNAAIVDVSNESLAAIPMVSHARGLDCSSSGMCAETACHIMNDSPSGSAAAS